MLRLDQIDLDEVARGRAAVAAGGEPHWFLDLLSGHVIRVSPDDPVDADRAVPRDWQLIHPGRTVVYGDLADFVDRLPASAARDRLDQAIQGRGPLVDRDAAARRFDRAIAEFDELAAAWAEFRAARARRDALRWLAKMEYVDVADAEQARDRYPDPPPPSVRQPIDADAIAKAVATDLRELYGERLQEVLLYGSYARGTADEESDLDLLVVLDEVESVYDETMVMSEVLWDHTLDSGVTVSAVPMSVARFQGTGAFVSRVQAEARRVS